MGCKMDGTDQYEHAVEASQPDPSDRRITGVVLRGTESSLTLRWRGLDSNFQYAGAVNLVVAPFMPPKARE